MAPKRTIKQLESEVYDLKKELERFKKRAKKAERKCEKLELAKESADLLGNGSDAGSVAYLGPGQATNVLRKFTDLMLEGTLGEDDIKDTCAICTDLLSLDSGLLQLNICQHIFCSECISEYMSYQESHQLDVKCPKCNTLLQPDEESGEYDTSEVKRMEDARWDDLLNLAQEAARLLPPEDESEAEEGSDLVDDYEEDEGEEEEDETGPIAFSTHRQFGEFSDEDEGSERGGRRGRHLRTPSPTRRRSEAEILASADKRKRMEDLVASRQRKMRKIG